MVNLRGGDKAHTGISEGIGVSRRFHIGNKNGVSGRDNRPVTSGRTFSINTIGVGAGTVTAISYPSLIRIHSSCRNCHTAWQLS
jgi:hypothetical protein